MAISVDDGFRPVPSPRSGLLRLDEQIDVHWVSPKKPWPASGSTSSPSRRFSRSNSPLTGSSCSALVSPARHFRSPSHALQSGPGGQRAGTRRHWDLVIAALRSPVSFARDELVTVTVREVHDGGLPSGAGRGRRDADFILIV